MTSMTREVLLTLISARIDIAFSRKEINRLFERFSEEEKEDIQYYDENKTHKEAFEIREVYMQGMRDCFKLLALLRDTQESIQI